MDNTVVQECDQQISRVREGGEKKEALKAVTRAALIASLVAILIVLAIAIPLGITSKQLNDEVVMITEGVSKVAICIMQLSTNFPSGFDFTQVRGFPTMDSFVGFRQDLSSSMSHGIFGVRQLRSEYSSFLSSLELIPSSRSLSLP